MCQSATYDFLLTFHSNHGPISQRFRDKWRFYGDISSKLDRLLTRFSRSQHFFSWISQKQCILWTKLLWHTNRKWYLTYRMVPCLVTLT